MFESRLATAALIVAALGLVSAPVAVALDDDVGDEGPVTVRGVVTAFLYDDREDGDEDDLEKMLQRVGAFVIDDDTVVEFGPWWYWTTVEDGVTDIIGVGDNVEVTGELELDRDGSEVLSAWKIVNEDTGEEITIKEEGRPPWAGGPKALGIVPWPLCLLVE